MSDIGIILIHWHNQKEVMQLVKALSTSSSSAGRMILVDNGGNFDMDDDYPIEVLRPGSNVGFAAGCNLGIRRAIALGCTKIALLNNDIVISPGDINLLAKELEAGSKLAAVAPILSEGHGKNEEFHLGGRNPLKDGQTRISSLQPIPNNEPDYLPGTVLMLKKEAFWEIGEFDETYFFSGEVADWFLRLKDTKWKYRLISSLIVHHTLTGNEFHRSKDYMYYSLRNRFLLIDKFGGNSKRKLKSIWTKQLRRQMIGAGVRLNFTKVMTIFKAIQDGRSGRFGKAPYFN